MLKSKRRWLLAIGIAAYLYFLLPATAVLFYELYHLTGIGFLYWGYSGFKAAGYYFSVWQYQLPAIALVFALIILIPSLFAKRHAT